MAGSWKGLLSLLVMNTSSRAKPLSAMALPTSGSLPYISAVSMCRYPASSAARTLEYASDDVAL